MGVYYNPVSDVSNGSVGRPVSASHHAGAMQQLAPGEHLYALCDRLTHKMVVCVDAPSEYDEFREMYTEGYLISFRLVALDNNAHKKALAGA